uniref:Ankyrin repeat and kinase domain containing 1 n=1 Tax=Seriola dumerili TaxID=41447 RepID=A0A3B4VED3_SERDU
MEITELVVRQLVKSGASTDNADSRGYTPLHLAALKGHTGICRQLLSNGADPNVTEDSEGWTPLHVACNSVCFPSVLHLLTHHADVNVVNSGKATPLHLAAQHGCVPIIKALLLNGADRTPMKSSHMKCLSTSTD